MALPLRWTALEAMITSRFSIETDVWSMGVLVWEILTRAKRPYDLVESEKAKTYLLTDFDVNHASLKAAANTIGVFP